MIPRSSRPNRISAKRLAAHGGKVPFSSITPKRTPAKKRPRTAEHFARVYGPPDRVLWIKAQPSVVSGMGPCENVHVTTGGTGRKANACWIVPLTPAEHRQLHQIGQRSFEQFWGVSLVACAPIVAARWDSMSVSERANWQGGRS